MSDDVRALIRDVRQWIEQERVWDNMLYAEAGNDQHSLSSSRHVISRDPATLIPTPMDPGLQPAGVTAKSQALQSLYETYKDCTRCPLGFTRIKFVFGVGSPDSQVLFIGEGPGYEEDRRGEPFVGKAGQLLDKMMEAIGLSRRTNAYIANIVKCHPMANPQTPEARGNDRAPHPEEVEACSPILLRQIALLQPRFIMTLGSPSTKMILRTKDGITGLRGRFFPFAVDAFYPETLAENPSLFNEKSASSEKIVSIDSATRDALRKTQVLPTYHPAALLRNPNLKPESWADLKLLRKSLSEPS